MSRVDAVNVATMKAAAQAGTDLRGTVAASDAFFPFRDGLDAIAQAGATAVAQPGGGAGRRRDRRRGRTEPRHGPGAGIRH